MVSLPFEPPLPSRSARLERMDLELLRFGQRLQRDADLGEGRHELVDRAVALRPGLPAADDIPGVFGLSGDVEELAFGELSSERDVDDLVVLLLCDALCLDDLYECHGFLLRSSGFGYLAM